MSFTFNVVQKNPVAIFSLYGDLIDRSLAQTLVNEVNELNDDGQHKFIFDMSEVKYMNSTGLNVLINVLTKSRKSGGDLVICCVSKKVQELLLVTKLNSVFSVADSTEEALEKFNPNN